MKRQLDEGSSNHASRANGFRRYSPRPGLVAVTLAALFLVTTSASSIFLPVRTVTAATETIATVAADYTTPKTSWDLGQTSHARVDGAPLPTGSVPYVRRVIWVAPDGSVAQIHSLDTDPDTDDYAIPASGEFAQVGIWTVKTIDNRGVGHAFATFAVLSPTAPNADLSITKSGPALVSAGSSVAYTVTVTNNGPDDAANVEIVDAVPDNTTLASETQSSGPPFTCSTAPDADGVDTTTCTVSSLPANATATFVLIYNVDSSAPNGTLLFNAAKVSSTTNEVDSSNNSASVVTKVSSTAPCSITCPANITQDNDAGQCGAVVSYPAPTASNCAGVTCTPSSGTFFPLGTTRVTCAGDTGDPCSFTITVNDTDSHTLTCPADITTAENPAGSGGATVTYTTPTSGCSGETVTCSPPSGAVFGIGTTSVTCTSTAGLNCSFSVTVNPVVVCRITCPPDITTFESSPGSGSATVDYPPPTQNNCSGVTVTCTPPSGSSFPVGTTNVNCTASDGSGTVDSCSFTVTVNSIPACSISCPGNVTKTNDPDQCGALVDYPTPTISGGCDGESLACDPPSGSFFNVGTTTVNCAVNNAVGTPFACSFTVTVTDETAPTAVCKNITVALNAAGTATISGADVDNGSSDNCTIVSRTVSPNSFTCADKGTRTVTLTVTDGAGHSANCQATVTVIDNSPPTISCPANIVQSTAPNSCSAVVNFSASANDNCPGVTYNCSPPSGSTFAKGTTAVTCTATDASGLTASCQFTVTVNDTQPPAIACSADIVADFDPAVNGAVVTYTAPAGTDNCPGATTTQIAGLPSGATFPVGTTTNTFRVTDASGNTAQCSFKVTVAITSIIGLESVSITGAGLADSYDSTGGYPATKGSLANILSNGTITLANSGKVFGNVRSTRAGVNMSGASSVTGNATAGTTVSRTGSATVGGTITNNALAPVMTMPSVAACGGPYSPNTGISGTYSYNQSTGDLSLSGVNIATLANGTYCFHNITLTNSAQLKVNGLVVIKLTGTLNASGATRFTNTTGVPGSLRILSSYTGTTGVTLGNSTNVQLVIYAPGTGVSISGAAPLFGTVVAKKVTIGNSGMIHYDTQLKNIWPDIWSSIP